MKIRLRHGIYWAVVAIGIVPILFAVSGTWLNDHLEPLYGKLRSWTHQDRYGRRS
jgi:hypothetical protein